MIPTIGVMIGLYILTRMVELLGAPVKRHVKFLGIVTIIGSILGIVGLARSSDAVSESVASFSGFGRTPAELAPHTPSLGLPSSAAPSEPSWETVESKDPMDDSPKVILRLSATSGSSRFGEAPILMLRCKGKSIEAFVTWHDYMGSDAVAVTSRLGSSPATRTNWGLSTSGKATFYPGNVVRFVKALMIVDTLVVSATPYNESPVTAIFRVTGLSAKVDPLQKACGWN